MEPWGWGCRAGVWPGWGLRIMELGQRVRARLPGVLSEGQGAGARVRVRPLEVRSKGQGAGEAGEGQAPGGASEGRGAEARVRPLGVRSEGRGAGAVGLCVGGPGSGRGSGPCGCGRGAGAEGDGWPGGRREEAPATSNPPWTESEGRFPPHPASHPVPEVGGEGRA